MAKRTIEERLAQLEVQRQTLKARLGKQERARDTRRKVLLGALVLHRLGEDKCEFDKALKEWLQRELPGFLTRPDDKALFNDLLAPPATRSQQDGSNTSESDQMATGGTPET